MKNAFVGVWLVFLSLFVAQAHGQTPAVYEISSGEMMALQYLENDLLSEISLAEIKYGIVVQAMADIDQLQTDIVQNLMMLGSEHPLYNGFAGDLSDISWDYSQWIAWDYLWNNHDNLDLANSYFSTGHDHFEIAWDWWMDGVPGYSQVFWEIMTRECMAQAEECYDTGIDLAAGEFFDLSSLERELLGSTFFGVTVTPQDAIKGQLQTLNERILDALE